MKDMEAALTSVEDTCEKEVKSLEEKMEKLIREYENFVCMDR